MIPFSRKRPPQQEIPKPDYAETHYNRGFIHSDSGMYLEAIEAYKQAIQIKPDFAEAHNNLGTTYYDSGMYLEAIEAYKQAIQVKPDYAEAHNNLGLAYGRSGMYQDQGAIGAFKEAILIKPDFVDAHYNLGISYIILNNKSGALGEYNVLKNFNPQSANKLFNLIHKR